MSAELSEYAKSGVDYRKIIGFKELMQDVGKRTARFPEPRGFEVLPTPGMFAPKGRQRAAFKKVHEGLGNKNWIAEWLYLHEPSKTSHYDKIAYDTAMMAVNDVIAAGALPIVATDEVVAKTDSWFSDTKRSAEFAEGFFRACKDAGMALIAGESPAYRYLVNPEPPVQDAPILSCCVTGVVPDGHDEFEWRVKPGDYIIGITSSGMHANGASLIIRRGLTLPDQFFTKIPETGRTYGEEALIPTRCYADFVAGILDALIEVHALIPGTGGGVAKLATEKAGLTYRILDWPKIPPLFRFVKETFGIPSLDILTTFNCGVGLYAIVPKGQVDVTLIVAGEKGYEALVVGRVEEGERCVIFGPEGDLKLPPPGE